MHVHALGHESATLALMLCCALLQLVPRQQLGAQAASACRDQDQVLKATYGVAVCKLTRDTAST